MEQNYYQQITIYILRIILGNNNTESYKRKFFYLKNKFSNYSKYELLKFLKNQGLIIFFSEYKRLDKYLPELRNEISEIAREEKIGSLIIANTIKNLSKIFQSEKIPILIFKGIPLSLQITNKLSSRGCGDIDIFVKQENIIEAINLLKINGFDRVYGYFPKDLKSASGRYSLKVRNELPLKRTIFYQKQKIDLHWSLCKSRYDLPNFEEAWQKKESYFIGGQEIYTLGIRDALVYACYNSAKGNWDSLKNIIDINLLVKKIITQNKNDFKINALMKDTLDLCYFYTNSQYISYFLKEDKSNPNIKKIIKISKKSQIKIFNKKIKNSKLNFWDYKDVIEKNLRISNNFKDKFRIILGFILLPSSFNDPISGKDKNLLQAILYQTKRLISDLKLFIKNFNFLS